MDKAILVHKPSSDEETWSSMTTPLYKTEGIRFSNDIWESKRYASMKALRKQLNAAINYFEKAISEDKFRTDWLKRITTGNLEKLKQCEIAEVYVTVHAYEGEED